ncbi:hypothetical protein H113_02554 [Trichophyton rubrum MR1459]|uniref:Uncharacterized protein n=1 Tax=Trichophyton rubrum CBS 288.86 TaxID=1215330 RepID=A0A022W8U7_TRIRU|nr:hypothetical protein H100_02541 [Trichophyton rubrum MR850]EZF44129.1 hypothetical protein H102_02534 [Trichophyton rubrum CBS 100081]EZF54777.1 hypothetical protein H103_02548 [Trichophyton rubrum CBS 288.86]EZF97481.1 hypothetical protein H113_02554 [Trichophyton rubrum MR1459]EZG19013.1 hypothetical protein H107_02620 [Trichophyton rubrum CBS 202.88]
MEFICRVKLYEELMPTTLVHKVLKEIKPDFTRSIFEHRFQVSTSTPTLKHDGSVPQAAIEGIRSLTHHKGVAVWGVRCFFPLSFHLTTDTIIGAPSQHVKSLDESSFPQL